MAHHLKEGIAFEGEEIRRLLVDHSVEYFIRIAWLRKADILRKVYAKHSDAADIIVVRDLIRGNFTGIHYNTCA